MADVEHQLRLLRFENFEVDLRTGELRKAGVKQKFGGQPFQVLSILLERPGDVVTREELPEASLALATRIARHDPFALRMAKLSVNEMQDLQGQRQALQMAFKNYMMTIPHRKELGTFGEAVNETPARERIARTKRTG